MPILFLLRHPCAVVNSRLQLGWRPRFESLLSQQDLVEDHLWQFLPLVENAKSVFEQHVILWCIENYVPLQQLRQNEALVVFYEDLCGRPEAEVDRIAKFAGLDSSDVMLSRIKKPSSQIRKLSSIATPGRSLVASWKENIDETMLARAIFILEAFHLSSLYGTGTQPLMSPDLVLRP